MAGSLFALVESLLQPVGFLWAMLLVIAGVWLWRGRPRAALAPLGLALGLNLLGSTPFSPWLLARIERPYAAGSRLPPPADAVVMLGGTHNYSPRTALPFNGAESFDRVLTALEFMRQGRARALVLGGSEYEFNGQHRPDSDLLGIWIRGWRLPAGEVHFLGACANTRDEAERTARLARELGWRRVIVVSSAAHLRRGEAAFRRLGLDVVPAGCDFLGLDGLDARRRWHFVPQSSGCELFRTWLHEELGWWYYRARGWA